MMINQTWAYNRNDLSYRSTTQLIRALIDAASKGGNFLLNAGPTPEGVIQPEYQEGLRATGKWPAVNGEAIYGTTYGRVQGLPYGRMTAKGKTLYPHVFDMPPDRIEITGLHVKVASIRARNGKIAVKFRQAGGKLVIPVAGLPPDPQATVFSLSTR